MTFHVSNALSCPVHGQSPADGHPRSHVIMDGTTFDGELNTGLVQLLFQMRWANALWSKRGGGGRGVSVSLEVCPPAGETSAAYLRGK